MTDRGPHRAWAGLLVAASALLGACGANKAPQRESLQHGPFEIVAEGRRISTGAFPNISGNPFQTMEVTSFTVRHRGREVVVQHGARSIARFWTVLRLADAPRPALLVATTDVHLLADDDGRLVVQALDPQPSTNTVDLQWLDSDAGQPGPVLGFGIRRTEGAETLLQGGRYLRARQAVLDVTTLSLRPYAHWLERRAGEPLTGLNAGGAPALAFSPQRTQFVALGSDDRREFGLLVIDFAAGRNYGVAIDRRATRLRDGDDVTPVWLAHHYEWLRDADGRDRLQPRRAPLPWPWQGRVIPFGGHFVEYRIGPLGEAGLAALREWLARRFGGRWVPDPSPGAQPQASVWQPGGDAVRIHVSLGEERVSVYEAKALNASYSADGERWVRRIGEEFDAELRTGRLDALFLRTP